MKIYSPVSSWDDRGTAQYRVPKIEVFTNKDTLVLSLSGVAIAGEYCIFSLDASWIIVFVGKSMKRKVVE